MKKFLVLMVATLAAMQLAAAPVDPTTAMHTAKKYLSDQLYAGQIMSPAALNPVLVKAEMGDNKINQPVYYIFNTATTYLVIAGDDRATEILMVGDQPLDLNHFPDGLQYLLDCYKEQIEYLQLHPGLVVEKPQQATPSLKAATFGPLLTARWDQTAPYYNQCVFTYNGNSYQCVTGCPATSASMVMYYWKYPQEPTPSVPSYSFYLNDNYSMRVTAPALPSTTFDWANMKDRYTTYSTAQANAVATLMRYVGQAEKMDYGTEASGILSSEAYKIVNMFKLFGYDASTTRLVKKANYNNNNWAVVIQNEMKNGRPVVYLGISQTGGHAFNVDGYRESDGLYHVNFGWSGYGNSWYAMNAFTDPMDGYAYSSSQQAVVGIQPPGGESTIPEIIVDPETIDFGSVNKGRSVTQVFHVTGHNLLANTEVTFTKSGHAAYSVSPASLTAAEVEAGADITVTYAPTSTGTHTATIYAKNPGAPDATVALTGVGVSISEITADPTELDFTTTVGEPVTADFTLKGYNLQGTVYLKVVNSTGGFSISRENVTKAVAHAGTSITVTYNPTAPGNHSAQVMLRSKDTDTIYIDLTGKATVTTHTPVMQPANMDYVTQTSFRADWTDDTYAGVISSYTLECTGEGNTISVPGITNKNYTLENLTAGAMYTYKVKALYTDGTESLWSNIEQVTLLAGAAYEIGDVNTDGAVNISDVTALIDYLLGSGNINTDYADLNGDSAINISDVTSLIDKLLAGN
jgi:hypothetical protein